MAGTNDTSQRKKCGKLPELHPLHLIPRSGKYLPSKHRVGMLETANTIVPKSTLAGSKLATTLLFIPKRIKNEWNKVMIHAKAATHT